MTAFLAEDRRELLRWAICGAIVIFAHGALAASLLRWHDHDEFANPPAALVINLAPFPVSPPQHLTELPPGPEQVEAEASPQTPLKQEVKEQVEEKVETQETQEVKTEVSPAVDPEIVLAATPPKPEQQSPPAQVAQLPAPETTAPQMPKSDVAEIAAAPVQGPPSPDPSNAIPTWRNEITAQLERHKRYPADAANDRGIVLVTFSIDRQGRVTASRVVKSSGSARLDRAAIDMIGRAQPFPAPPAALPGAEVSLSVPVRFNMR